MKTENLEMKTLMQLEIPVLSFVTFLLNLIKLVPINTLIKVTVSQPMFNQIYQPK